MEAFSLLFLIVLVLGLVGFNLWRRNLWQDKQLRLREIIHAERMLAMEKNLPLPEADEEKYWDAIGGLGLAATQETRGGVFWVRLLALCLGLTCLFAGAGVVTAFLVITPESQDTRAMASAWPLGLIPVFVGIGLLLFFLLSKGMEGGRRNEPSFPDASRPPLRESLGDARG
jgi:hypothetical protein